MSTLFFDPATGWLLPVQGGIVTQGYGPAHTDPAVAHLYRKGYHTGIDIGGVNLGTDIIAPVEGIVTLAGPNAGYGNCVIIERRDGIAVLFGHLSRLDVTLGETVAEGDTIGGVGSTGVSTGVHLHYEYRRNGEDIDPAPFLDASEQRTRATVREALNLRTGPGTQFDVIDTAPAGARVTLAPDGWVRVEWNGRRGWMFSGYLDMET
jgi:murein DD-endopeptidase MepM/ murein hydrolase activator NlpD